MGNTYRIVKGFYATREGAFGLLRVYGFNEYGFPSTISGVLEGFHSQADARVVVQEWLRQCALSGVTPFTRDGVALCRAARYPTIKARKAA